LLRGSRCTKRLGLREVETKKVAAIVGHRNILTAVAMFHGVAIRGAKEHHTVLASLYPIDELNQADAKFPKLSEWTLSLDGNRDVQGYTAWLVSTGLRLAVRTTMSDPRAFDLPKRIGVFSLRSLTPARELNDRSVDEGL